MPSPNCVFIGMFRPLEFSFFLFLKAGAPIKACMNRQQCGRTGRQLAKSRLAAVSWCCMLCTLFAGLSPNPSQEIGQDSYKNIYKNVHIHTHTHIFRYKGYAPFRVYRDQSIFKTEPSTQLIPIQQDVVNK